MSQRCRSTLKFSEKQDVSIAVDWPALLTALVSGSAVWALGEFFTQRRAEHRRLYDVKLEAYAQWMNAMGILVARIKPSEEGTVTHVYGQERLADLGLMSLKLKLLENDPKARQLIEEVSNSLPTDDAQRAWDHNEDLALAFNWDVYHSRIDALIELVRNSRPG